MAIGRLTATTHGQTVRFDVLPEQPVTLGRSSECSVRLHDSKVSREHCRLDLHGDRLIVTDLESTHGLLYRGDLCAEFELSVGDGFHLGETFVSYEACDEAASFADAGLAAADADWAASDAGWAAADASRDPVGAGRDTADTGWNAAPPVPERAVLSRGGTKRSGLGTILRFAWAVVVQVVIFLLYAFVVILLLWGLKLKWPECDIYQLMDRASSVFR